AGEHFVVAVDEGVARKLAFERIHRLVLVGTDAHPDIDPDVDRGWIAPRASCSLVNLLGHRRDSFRRRIVHQDAVSDLTGQPEHRRIEHAHENARRAGRCDPHPEPEVAFVNLAFKLGSPIAEQLAHDGRALAHCRDRFAIRRTVPSLNDDWTRYSKARYRS